MALNLLAAIVLTTDYGYSAINTGTLPDLTSWSISGQSTVYSSDSSHISFAKTSADVTLRCTVFTPITIVNGSSFRLTFDADVSAITQYYVVTLRRSGVNVRTFPLTNLSTGSQSISFDFDSGGFDFDQVQVQFVGVAADIELSNIDLVSTSGADDFDNGNRVLVYWDTDNEEIQVQLEVNPAGTTTVITSGPDLGVLSRSQVTGVIHPRDPVPGDKIGRRSEYETCSDSTLLQFPFTLQNPAFPYIEKFETPNHPTCAIVPIVCDIYFQPPTIQGASPYLTDGQVTLSAISSHGDVRYSQNSEQMYEYMSNDTGLFTGLRSGTYRFYARDVYNCLASITVIIPLTASSSYGAKYQARYTDVQTQVQTIAQVLERGFTGDEYNSILDYNPITLNKDAGDVSNKFEVIRPTYITLNLVNEKRLQYIGLFSQDDRKYKIRWTHGPNSWIGFDTPSVFSMTLEPSMAVTGITATCGLASLSQYDFTDESGNTISGSLSLLQVICTILKNLDLNLDIRCGINRFAEGMDSDVDDDPLTQTFIDCATFIDDDGTPNDCSEVLEKILKPFNAYIIQQDERWCLLETDGQTSGYTYRDFDYTGVYKGNGAFDPIVEIEKPGSEISLLLADGNQALEIIPAFGKINLKQNLIPKKSIFPTDLLSWFVNSYGSDAYTRIFKVDGESYNGVEIVNLTDDTLRFVSPLFKIKTGLSDSIEIGFDYVLPLQGDPIVDPDRQVRFGNIPLPPWAKLKWNLRIDFPSGTSADSLTYNETFGWVKAGPLSTSISSLTIPSDHPDLIVLNVGINKKGLFPPGSIVKLVASGGYIRGYVQSYINGTGDLAVITMSAFGSGTFNAWEIFQVGLNSDDNTVLITEYSDTSKSFNKKIELPVFTSPSDIILQFQLEFEGTSKRDYTSPISLPAIDSVILPVGTSLRGPDPDDEDDLIWYKLIASTADEDAPAIIRPHDYDNQTNPAVWERVTDDLETFTFVKRLGVVKISNLNVKYLPQKQTAPTEASKKVTNNGLYKETLPYEIDCGDSPAGLQQELYINVFRLQDGSPTSGWKRKDFNEALQLQDILLKNLGNQYARPSWKLGGALLARNISFNSIVKYSLIGQPINIVNQALTTGTGWTSEGSGTRWRFFPEVPDNNVVVFGGSDNGSSLQRVQSVNVNGLNAGSRIRIKSKITRSDSAGVRIDRFVVLTKSEGQVVQKVTLVEGMQSDGDWLINIVYTLDQDADNIGFMVELITGDGDDATYTVDYFEVNVVASTRYFYVNQLTRNDRHNDYQSELVQLMPAIASASDDDDDTGEGNTGNEPGSGGSGGNGFNGGFSNGFGGGFDTVLN